MAVDRSLHDALLAEINSDLPQGLDWRQGALDYVDAEMTKHGRDAYANYMLSKPLAPVSPDPQTAQAAILENYHYLANFINVFRLLNLPGGSRILDVACGSGWVAQWFARMNYDSVGFDISGDMIGLARQRFGTDPLLGHLSASLDTRLFVLDIERAPLPAHLHGTVHAVVLESCMHHFHDPVTALSNLVQGLADDGLMVVIEGENRQGPLNPDYVSVMKEFATLERPYSRAQIERIFGMAGLSHYRFVGRVNGWYALDDPQVARLGDIVREDAANINLAICAKSEAALRRVFPHDPAPAA